MALDVCSVSRLNFEQDKDRSEQEEGCTNGNDTAQ